MRALLFAFMLVAAVVTPALSQEQPPPANCSDGTAHDDGSFETGVGWQPFASTGEYVMRIDPPAAPAPLESVCICWQRTDADSQVFFDINVWAADGANGAPGTLLGSLTTVSASSVTSTAKFYRYNLSSLNITAPGPIYVGPRWAPNDDQGFFVCMDSNGPIQQPAYGGSSILGGPPNSRLGQVGFFPQYRTLGIRAKFGETLSACTPSSTAMCLNNNRFRVSATFLTSGGQSGNAQVVKLTDDTGYLWFFSSTNVEAVVKVLNACSLNNRYWVFAGGLTNVRTVITVTDTQTGTTKPYTNPQNTPFQPIQDTSAFATCP